MGTRDTCRLGRHLEEFSRLCYSGHVSHSQASGESITRWTSRRTRELPGLASGFGTWGQVSCSEGDSEGGVSRSFRQGFATASKGFRVTRRAPKGSERGCFGVARPEGDLRRGFREGVFEGG